MTPQLAAAVEAVRALLGGDADDAVVRVTSRTLVITAKRGAVVAKVEEHQWRARK